jgi:1-phosphofructokinase
MHTHAAGKGVNVAQVLADLGHQLTVSGFLGEDNLQAFETLFAKRGFVDAFIRVPGETRSNIKVAEHDGRITDINGPGPVVDAAAQQALLERLLQIAPGHDAVVVAGSLPRGVSAQWLRS